MSDSYDFDTGFARTSAQDAARSRADAYGVPAKAAGDAIQNGPAAGIPARVGMHDPQQVNDAAQSQRDTAISKVSPPVSSFVASSPAHAAVAQGDYGNLARTGALARMDMTFGEYVKQLGPLGDMADAFTESQGLWERAKKRGEIAQAKGDEWGQFASRATEYWAGLGGLTSPFAMIGEPIGRAIFHAPDVGGPDYSTTRFGKGPTPHPEQSLQAKAQAAEFLGNVLTAFVKIPRIPALRMGERPPPIDLGEARIVPEGGGGVGDFQPGAPRLPAPQKALPAPGVHPASDLAHGAQAEADAAHVSALQESVAESATHERSPTAMETFLHDHTPLGDRVAEVPAQSILDLRAEGHDVFPSYTADVARAVVTGGRVAIPLSHYLVGSAGQTWADDLNAVTNFREGGVSVEESKGLMEGHEARATAETQPDVIYHADRPGVGLDPSIGTLHYSDRLTAEVAAGTTGSVSSRPALFANPLEVATPAEANASLGLPATASMPETAAAAREAGHDVIVLDSPRGKEYLELPPQESAAPRRAAPYGMSSRAPPVSHTPEGAPEEEDLSRQAQEMEGKPGISLRRMATMFGPQLYGDPTETAAVSAKEVLQNSFDAIKGALDAGAISSGKIHIELNRDNRTVTFHDNGVGMAPSLLGGKFLEIAGSEKGKNASGGFGVAKMLFLYGNQDLHVQTMKDGVYSEMKTSGPELMNALEGDGPKPKIQFHSGSEIPEEAKKLFPDGHGTRIQMQIPESYEDQNGVTHEIPFPTRVERIPAIKYSPLFAPIEVTTNKPYWEGEIEPVEGIGASFPAENYTTFANVKFPWGTARIYISRERKESYGENVHVLSNGLWQFDEKLPIDPQNPWKNLPYEIYLDINPSVKPDQAGYPFGFNRQAFTASAAKDLAQVKLYIQKTYSAKILAEQASEFATVRYLSPHGGNYSSEVELKPELPPSQTGFDTLHEGDKVEVIEGKLIVNGKEIPTLTPEDLKASIPSSSELKVDQKLVDPKRIMVHDNTTMTPEDTADNPFPDDIPFSEAMRRKFGSRFTEFERLVGAAFLDLRDMTAEVMKYSELKTEAIGISYDKTYRGVSIKVPFNGMFINPVAAEGADAVEKAYGILGTMIHELAHFKVRSHNASFPAEMQRIMYKLQASGTLHFVEWQEDVVRTLATKYEDILKEAGEAFDNDSVKNSASSFSDTSSESIGDEGDAGVPEELDRARQGTGGGPEVPGGLGKGPGSGDSGRRVPGVSEPGEQGVGGFLSNVDSTVAEARQVMDAVERELGIADVFKDPKSMGLTQALFNRYAVRLAKWREETEAKLIKKMVAQFHKEHSPDWKAAIQLYKEEAKKQILAQPNIQAFLDAKIPGLKLDSAALKEQFPDLPLPKEMQRKNGISLEDAAELNNYPTPSALITDLYHTANAISAAGGFSKYVNSRTAVYAEEMARKETGYDLSPEGIRKFVEEAVVGPTLEDILADEMKQFADANALPFDFASVKLAANYTFGKLTASIAANPRKFAENMRRLGNQAELALDKGDVRKAFTLKQQQLLQLLHMREAFVFQKRFNIGQRKMARWARKPTIQGLSQPFLDQMHNYLPHWGFKVNREPQELLEALKGVTFKEFVDDVVRTNSTFPPIPQVDPAAMKDLTVNDYYAVRGFVEAMNRYGRELQTAQGEVKRMAFNDAVVEALRSVPAKPPPKGPVTPVPIDGEKHGPFQAVVNGFFRYDAFHRKAADLVEWMDRGDENGPWARNLIRPLYKGADVESRLTGEAYDPVKAAWDNIPDRVKRGYNARIEADRIFTVKGVKLPDGTTTPRQLVSLYRRNIPLLALYAGTHEGLDKAAQGFGLTADEVLEIINAHITPEEVAMVQAVWKGFADLAPTVSEELRSLTREGLRRVEAAPVRLGGIATEGGYWPIEYSRDLNPDVALWEADREAQLSPDGVSELFGNLLPNKGFAEERTDYVGAVNLDLSQLSRVFNAHIKYAAYARAVSDARRFLSDPRIAGAIEQTFGKPYLDVIPSWIDGIVKPYQSSEPLIQWVERTAEKIGRNMSSAILVASYTTLVSQASGAANAIALLGRGNPYKGIVRFLGGMGKLLQAIGQTEVTPDGVKWTGFDAMFSRSEMMRHRYATLEQNMTYALMDAEALDPKLIGAKKALKTFETMGFHLIGLTEFLTVSAPQWYAAEQMAIEEGKTPEDAAYIADRAVIKNQGSGRAVDLSSVQRMRGIGKLFYAFQSYWNQSYQTGITVMRGFKGGGPPLPPEPPEGVGADGEPPLPSPKARFTRANSLLLFFSFFILSNWISNFFSGQKNSWWDPIDALFRPLFVLNTVEKAVTRHVEFSKDGHPFLKQPYDTKLGDDLINRGLEILEQNALLALAPFMKRKADGSLNVHRPVQTVAGLGELAGVPGSAALGRAGEYIHELQTGEQVPKSWTDVYWGLMRGPRPEQKVNPALGREYQ